MVREAFRALAERRLIEVVIGRGAFVRPPASSDAADALKSVLQRHQITARDVVKARLVLECHAAEEAARRATPEEVAERGWRLEALEREPRILKRIQHDLGFHFGVVRAAHNPVLQVMFSSTSELIAELMLRSLSDEQVTAAGMPHHRSVFEAIRTGDADAARRAMESHHEVATDTYGEDLDHRLDTLADQGLRRALHGHGTLAEVLAALDLP